MVLGIDLRRQPRAVARRDSQDVPRAVELAPSGRRAAPARYQLPGPVPSRGTTVRPGGGRSRLFVLELDLARVRFAIAPGRGRPCRRAVGKLPLRRSGGE